MPTIAHPRHPYNPATSHRTETCGVTRLRYDHDTASYYEVGCGNRGLRCPHFANAACREHAGIDPDTDACARCGDAAEVRQW